MADMDLQSRFCPECGAKTLSQHCIKSFVCELCGFTYFHNVAAAVGAIILCENKLLLVKRGMQPAKDLWDLPGGFVDPGESNEQALQRELMEELQLAAEGLYYLCSYPNTYRYKEVNYYTADSFFVIQLSSLPELIMQQSELNGLCWFEPAKIDTEQLAFTSTKKALEHFLMSQQADHITNHGNTNRPR